ncbi:MAG: hypothetical protein HQ463_09055 [Bacteroidetes bacterium]|nr:hypothetical protein [Bacteroidota bacterium]
MKKQSVILSLVAAFMLNTTEIFAQKKLVNSAETGYSSDIVQAKYDIDKAALHPETINSPQMWYVKGAVYTIIAESEDAKVRALDKEAAFKGGEALNKFFSFSAPEIKRYKDAALSFVPSAAINCYNASQEASSIKDNFTQVENYVTFVQNLVKIDDANDRKLEGKISIEKTYIICLNSAQLDSLEDKQIVYLEKLTNSSYKDASIFLNLANIYTKKDQYDKALEVLKAGRLKFEDQASEFLKYEINIDIERGNSVGLIQKLNTAIAEKPSDAIYYFNRGVTYQVLKEKQLEKKESTTYYFSQAFNDYAKALTMDENNVEYNFNMASILVDSANSVFDKAINEENIVSKKALTDIYKVVYKQAIEKMEIVRLSGEKSGQDLLTILKLMRGLSKKIADTPNTQKYNTLYNEQKATMLKE